MEKLTLKNTFLTLLCSALLLVCGFAFSACDLGNNKQEFNSQDITITDLKTTYNGEAQIFNVTYGDLPIVVTYSTDGTNFKTKDDLNLVEPGTYQVYVKVSLSGYDDYITADPVTFTITKDTVNKDTLSITNQEVAYNGNAQIFNITYGTNPITITYSQDGKNWVSASELNLVEPGTYKVYFKISLDGYFDYVSVLDFTITKGVDVLNDDNTLVGSYETLSEAIQNSTNDTTIVLHKDIKYESLLNLDDKTLNINLRGHRIVFTAKASSTLTNSASLTIKNGAVDYDVKGDGTKAAFNIQKNCSMTLDNVNFITNSTGLYPQGDSANVTVNNCTIIAGVYAIATNASKENISANNDAGVHINLTNSKFITTSCVITDNTYDYDDCTICMNVPGILTINDCYIEGNRVALLVRGGHATVTNSTIQYTGLYADKDKYLDSNWGTGNEVVSAGIVLGNRYPTAYTYSAELELTKSKIYVQHKTDRAIYVYQDSEKTEWTAKLTCKDISYSGLIIQAGAYDVYTDTKITSYDTFADALQNASDGATIVVHKDITYADTINLDSKTLTINLNKHTLTCTANTSSTLTNGASLTIKNGAVDYDVKGDGTKTTFNIQTNCSMTLDNVNFITNSTGLYPQGDSANVIVKDSTITAGVYTIATNASKENISESNDAGVHINLTNSKFITTSCVTADGTYDYDDCTICMNVPGVLTIDNCSIKGNRVALLVRGGSATVTNSTIEYTGLYTDKDKYLNSNWGTGNEVVSAGIVLGNRSPNAYQYDATLTISNTTISTADTDRAIYIYEDSTTEYKATLTASDLTYTGTITKNNEAYTLETSTSSDADTANQTSDTDTQTSVTDAE